MRAPAEPPKQYEGYKVGHTLSFVPSIEQRIANTAAAIRSPETEQGVGMRARAEPPPLRECTAPKRPS